MTARNFFDVIYRILTRRPVYHGLFWLLMFAVAVAIGHNPAVSIWFTLSNELINLLFYAVLVYVNIRYLVPNYLARHVLLYTGLVLAACAVVTPIKVLVLYLKFSGLPYYRVRLVESQGFLFIGAIVVTLFSTLLKVFTDWWRYQREKQQLVTQTMQSELRFLKSQINPHFLFNTLNNLYALTLKKSDKAPEIVLKLSEIMRYMLYECNEKRVLLSKEIQYIHNYLDLERLRQTGNADIRFETEGHISDQMVAPLLFVPFLENSFKHGLNHYVQGGGFVRARLSVSGEDLEFYIENSKTEHAPRQEHPRSGGIGLANVRQRLNLLYPDQHDLSVDDAPHRFAVTLHLKMT
ncbi:MAG: histidine kinase [Saprospiraceae bacterium]|nr:histidine kinase [Saprospiraceae bacterium]MCC7506772.1 histidine kinase [Saprospiraceae bacterium]